MAKKNPLRLGSLFGADEHKPVWTLTTTPSEDYGAYQREYYRKRRSPNAPNVRRYRRRRE